MAQISDWIMEEFSDMNIGDKRLVDRCRLIMAMLSAQCQASIPVACRGWAEIKGAYRFFENEVVTLASVLATLTARSVVVTLRPPYRKGEKLAPVTVHAVLLREETPAKGIEPLEWLLLTDLPVNTWEEVQFVINGYLCRWQIECFFKVLKSGCKVENLQLQTPERFLSCLGLYLIISWRVLYLTMMGRSCPGELPCTLFFDESEWKAIMMIEKGKLPEVPPPLTEMVKMIAQQGSYVGRKGDDNPGIVSFWVGLQRVMDYARAWVAFGPERHETCG